MGVTDIFSDSLTGDQVGKGIPESFKLVMGPKTAEDGRHTFVQMRDLRHII